MWDLFGLRFKDFFGQNLTKSPPNPDPILANALLDFMNFVNLYLMYLMLSEKFVSGTFKRFMI